MARRQQITDLTNTGEMVAEGSAYHANGLRLNDWWRLFLAEEIAQREAKLRGRSAGRGDRGPAVPVTLQPAGGPAGGGDLAWDEYVAPAVDRLPSPAANGGGWPAAANEGGGSDPPQEESGSEREEADPELGESGRPLAGWPPPAPSGDPAAEGGLCAGRPLAGGISPAPSGDPAAEEGIYVGFDGGGQHLTESGAAGAGLLPARADSAADLAPGSAPDSTPDLAPGSAPDSTPGSAPDSTPASVPAPGVVNWWE